MRVRRVRVVSVMAASALVAVGVLGSGPSAWAASPFVEGDYVFAEVAAGEVAVTGANTVSPKMEIPGSVTHAGQVYQVTAIADDAFFGAAIESVVIPASVTDVGSSAFTLSGARTVRFAGNAPSVEPATSTDSSFGAGASVLFPVAASGYASPSWQGYAAKSYAVLTFDPNGRGDAPPALIVPSGQTVMPSSSDGYFAPYVEGYRWLGWYVDKDNISPVTLYTFASVLPADKTVYSGWESETSLAPTAQSLTGTVGQPVSPTQSVQATGFVGNVTYSVAPALPDGLSLNSQTGVVTGTPSAVVSGTYTLTATGSTSGQAHTQLTITITAALSPAAPVNLTVSAIGSQAVVSWTPGTTSGGPVEYLVTETSSPQARCVTVGTTCHVSELTPGRSYVFIVQARWGNGPLSSPAVAAPTVITEPQPPAAEALPAASSDGVGVTVSVNGQPIEYVEAGATVTASGAGFLPGSTVYLYAYSTPQLFAEVTVDASGGFNETVTFPIAIPAGPHRIVAQGYSTHGEPVYGIAPVRVAALFSGHDADVRGTGVLASTGATFPGIAVVVAVVFLLCGGAALRRSRRA